MAMMALRAKVDRARGFWRGLLAAEGGMWTVAALLAGLLGCFYVDRQLALTVEARIGAWAVLGSLFSALFYLLVLRPVLRPLTAEEVAATVERRYPQLRERLLTAVEFEGASTARIGVSQALIGDVQAEAEREAGSLNFSSAFDLRGLRRSGGGFGLAAVLIGLQFVLAPQAFGRFLERMALMHKPVWRDTMPQVDPPSTKVLKGSDFTVSVEMEGKPVDRARLQFRFGDGRWNSVEVKRDAEGAFAHRFTGITEDVSYRATAGDGISDYGKAVVVDPAAVVGAKLTLGYPDYLGRPNATFPADSGGIAAPVGTRVTLELRANKPLELATATVPGLPPTNWSVDGATIRGAVLVRGNGQYSLRLKDTDGFFAPEAQSFPIKAIPDEAPEVQLVEPAGDLDVVPDARVPLSILAKDDYGIAQVRVPYQVEGRKGAVLPAGRGEDHKTRLLELDNLWSLASLKLKPGDSLRYRIEATDFDNVSGPHVGKTSDYQIRIIDRGEATRRYEENRQELLRQFAELIREQKAARADVEAQRNAAAPNADAIAAAEERQRSAAATAQDLARRVGELSRQAAMNNLSDKTEQEAQKAVQQGLDRLSRQEMPEAANRIGSAQAQARSTPASAKPTLGEASQQQQRIAQELQRLAEAMKPGSELERLANRFQRLAQEQRNLQGQTEKMLPQTLGKAMNELTPEQRQALQRNAQQQQSLQRATQQAMQDLDRASQGMQQRSPEQSEAAREVSEGLRQGQVGERQQQAAENTQQNALGQAQSQQGEAAQRLEQAAQQLRQAQNPNDPRALERQLRQAMNQLNRMMQQQQEAIRQTRSLQSPEQRRELAQLQRQMAQRSREMARQLEKLQRRTPSAGKASQSMQQAAQNAGQAGQQLDQGQQEKAESEERQSLQQMQRAMQSLQQAMAEAQQESDPFAALRKALTALAGKQKAIHQATARIHDEQETRGPQMDDTPALQKLAQQQAEVEDATQKLEPELPGDVFRSFSQDARRAMTRAKDGLHAGNPKANPTQNAEKRALTTLEQLVKALDPDPKDNSEEEGGGGQGGQGGQGGEEDKELPKRIAEIRLLRFMEQAIRAQTQEVDDGRNERDPLTEAQKEQIGEAERRQSDAKAMADRVAQALNRYRQLAGKVTDAGKHMGEAERYLGKQETGEGAQEQESQAIIRLTEALRMAQRQQRQQQQRQQARNQRGGRQPGQPQAGQQPGQAQAGQGQMQQGGNPAMQSLQRRAGRQDGTLGGIGVNGKGFAGLDARSQDALLQGAQEKKPVEYQDLINRYLSALSNKGR